jgi:hypothetical protein
MGLRLEDIADVLGHETMRMARGVYVHAQGRPIDAATTLGAVLGGEPLASNGSPNGSPTADSEQAPVSA